MSIPANTFKQLQHILTPSEIPLFRVILSDRRTCELLATRDYKSLAKMYGVSMYTFEDSFLWKRRVKIANRAGKFALTRNAQDVFCVDDDAFGTVGCSIIERIKVRDHCRLPSTHVAGSRIKVGIVTAVAMVNQDLLTAVTAE